MVHILIDFDNFYKYSTTDDFSWLLNELNYLVDLSLAIKKDLNYIDIRCYGGWMERAVFTNAASRIQTAVSSFNFFPIFNKRNRSIIRGAVNLITRLSSIPTIEWNDTVRTRTGIPRIRLNNSGLPTNCIGNNSTCPVRILYRFAKSRSKICPVSGCNVTNNDAFKIVEQKMVDTMISCDIVTLSYNNNCEGIIVLSDDFDLLPPIAVAISNYNGSLKKVCLIRTNENHDYEIVKILQNNGLKVKVRR